MSALNPLAAHELAGDLLAALSDHIGDTEGVAKVLRRWGDELDHDDLALVAVGAVWRTFTECLTYANEAPPGAVMFTERTDQ